ncbi:sll1863 family stress response protein [Desulfosporosinus fructosivorans]
MFEANLAKYNAKLAVMKAGVAEVKADMKLEYLSHMDSLEKKRDAFLEKYEQLKETSELGWEDIKIGTEKSWNELKDSIEKGISRFSKLK